MKIAEADVKMSSTFVGSSGFLFDGSKVVDGIYAPIGMHEFTSIAITLSEPSPWMQIDLSKKFCVSAVKIWKRYMASHGNLRNKVILKVA